MCGHPRPDDDPYVVAHGAGYTRYEHNSEGLSQTVTAFVDWTYPLKIVRLRMINRWDRVRRRRLRRS